MHLEPQGPLDATQRRDFLAERELFPWFRNPSNVRIIDALARATLDDLVLLSYVVVELPGFLPLGRFSPREHTFVEAQCDRWRFDTGWVTPRLLLHRVLARSSVAEDPGFARRFHVHGLANLRWLSRDVRDALMRARLATSLACSGSRILVHGDSRLASDLTSPFRTEAMTLVDLLR